MTAGTQVVKEDLWKEQLTLISGNILILGIALLKLWPMAARLQTTENVHYFSQAGPQDGAFIFKTLTDVMSIAVAVVGLAMLHILCRGLWLAISEGPIKVTLNRMCSFTFTLAVVLVCFLVILIILGVPVIVISMGLETFLMSHFHMSARASTWIIAFLAPLFFLFMMRPFQRAFKNRINTENLGNALQPVRGFSYPIVSIIFLGFSFFILEGCYTLDLTSNTAICHRARGDIAQIDLTLGGATSSPSAATLQLVDSSGHALAKLEMQEVGEGHYMSYVSSSSFKEGYYRVVLDYPHPSLSLIFPFIRSTNHRSCGFVVIP